MITKKESERFDYAYGKIEDALDYLSDCIADLDDEQLTDEECEIVNEDLWKCYNELQDVLKYKVAPLMNHLDKLNGYGY